MVNDGQPLCICDAPEGLLISMRNQGIQCIPHAYALMELTSVVKRDPSVILGITKTAEKLFFSDSHDHSVDICNDGKVIHWEEDSQGCKTVLQFGFIRLRRFPHMENLYLSVTRAIKLSD